MEPPTNFPTDGPTSGGPDAVMPEPDPPDSLDNSSGDEPESPAASVPPVWKDIDGGAWRLYPRWNSLPRRAGLLAVILRHADGIVHDILEWHPARNLRAIARSRLHAVAPSFVGSPAAQGGGMLCFGVLIPGKRRRRRCSPIDP